MPFSNGSYSLANASECICIDGFQWVEGGQACARNCTNYANSFELPNLLDGKTNECICSDGYVWTKDNLCIYDCLNSTNDQC
jgi:hypothetical protein